MVHCRLRPWRPTPIIRWTRLDSPSAVVQDTTEPVGLGPTTQQGHLPAHDGTITSFEATVSTLTLFPYGPLRPSMLRYDTIRDAILTCARKPTWVSLIYRTETTTKNCKTEKLKSKNRYRPMLEVTVKVWGIMSVLKKKKKGWSGKDLA